MRKIDTTQINDPGTEQPLLGPSIDFITQNELELLNSVVRYLIGTDPVYNPAAVYVLYGCVITGVTSGAGNFAMTAGAIFVDGEIMQVAAVPTTAVGGGNSVGWAITDSATPTDPLDNVRALDPVTFSDGTTKNVHRTVTLTTYVAPTGSVTGLVSSFIYLNVPQVYTVGGGGANPAFSTGYSALNGLIFWKDAQGLIHIQGDFQSAGTDVTGVLFTLPADMRPARTVYGQLMTTGSNSAVYKRDIAYFCIVQTNGQINFSNSGLSLPMDVNDYCLIFTPFTTK